MVSEGASPWDAAAATVLVDSRGLVYADRPGLEDDKRRLALDAAGLDRVGVGSESLGDPVAIARAFRPTILAGTSGTPGLFSEALIREVARHDPMPIILPLSNPSSKAEATPESILAWSDGRALVASGSPFGPVDTPAGTRIVGQGNNVFIFPGLGLGAIVAEAREIPDEFFLEAARVLASHVSEARRASGALYPPISDLPPGTP